MKRLVCAICGVVLLAVTAPLGAQGEKLTVKEIMGRVNKGPTAVFPAVRKNLNADAPDWAELQKQAKEIATLAEAMTKKDPPRGEKASWEKFSKDYAAEAKALADAAQKKDKDGMIGLHAKITKACSACHMAHRPQ
jgi:cytochrome c556